MKKIIAAVLSVLMLVSVLAAASSVSADGTVKVRIFRDGCETALQAVTAGNPADVTLSQNGENVLATTVGGTDQCISIALPDIDASVYDTIYINYKASGPIFENGIYLKGTVFNTDYSGTAGTFTTPNLKADGNWNTSGYTMQVNFPAMKSYKISGIRIPVCSTANDTFELHSIEFRSSAYFTSIDVTPHQTGKVFGGWFTDAAFTTAATSAPAFAKFVDKNVHKVKWQLKNGTTPQSTTTDIRLVTTIDSLDYKNVGFEITYGDKTVNVSTTKAFKQLKAAGAGVSPTVFSAQSQYFVTFVIANVPVEALDKSFSAKAYWTTLGGDTVTGTALSFCVNEPDGASARVVSSGTGSTVSLLTDEMTGWVNSYTPMELDDLCDFTEKCEPLPVSLRWDRDDDVLYTHVLISQKEDMSNPDVYLCFENSLNVEDLFSGTTYYWQLRKEYADKVRISKVNSFTTLQAPRTVALDGVSNVRDIGGYYSADGNYRMKQGIIYRGADFVHITADGIDKAVNILGINTEIDLREANPTGSSPLGATVNYVSVSAPWYTQIWDEPAKQAEFVTAMRVFTDSNNFPVYFHCSLGRDRTGTLAFFLQALCGVSEEDITMDYEVSFFSNVGGYVDTSVIPSGYTRNGLYAMIYRLRQETGETELYNAVRKCLLDLGMTNAELDAIRANLLTEVH